MREVVEAQAVLDYPQEGEAISSPQYTLRIAATTEAQKVEVSIDKGPWQACRESVGCWWYDWSGYQTGKHQAAARIQTKDGKVTTSNLRRFRVN